MEEWRQVVGVEGYEVSNLGRVRSIDREYASACRWGGLVTKKAAGRAISQHSQNSGHMNVTIGRGRIRSVHRLVLEAFAGPCPSGMEACHNNGDPSDNSISNLRWDTRKANRADKSSHWTGQPTRWNMPMSEIEVSFVKTMMAVGSTNREIHDTTGVSMAKLQRIRSGASWSSVEAF